MENIIINGWENKEESVPSIHVEWVVGYGNGTVTCPYGMDVWVWEWDNQQSIEWVVGYGNGTITGLEWVVGYGNGTINSPYEWVVGYGNGTITSLEWVVGYGNGTISSQCGMDVWVWEWDNRKAKEWDVQMPR